MHLVSCRNQTVTVSGASITFEEGETIHTENSYKHRPGAVISMARSARWAHEKRWTDPERLFGVFLFRHE
jgi:uncharacterized SAM-dependent methyltransferase